MAYVLMAFGHLHSGCICSHAPLLFLGMPAPPYKGSLLDQPTDRFIIMAYIVVYSVMSLFDRPTDPYIVMAYIVMALLDRPTDPYIVMAYIVMALLDRPTDLMSALLQRRTFTTVLLGPG